MTKPNDAIWSSELPEAALDQVTGGSMILQAVQAYQAWMLCLKSCADSKGQIQGELARFR